MTSGSRDLQQMLATLDVTERDEDFVFVTLPEGHPLLATAAATVREDEGITAVIPRADADRHGIGSTYVAAWLTLTVHSALDAVGLTAAVATALAAAGISCNVLAGVQHDHLLVPADRRRDAVHILKSLAAVPAQADDGITESGPRIRPFDLGDLDRVVAIWQAAGVTRPWNDPVQDIHRKLRVQPELFLVAELDGVVVGAVMGGYDGHRGWIHYLAVDPSVQRGGVGRLLVQRVETALAAMGCPKVQLQVRPDNECVLAFYERLGYDAYDAANYGKRLVDDQAG